MLLASNKGLFSLNITGTSKKYFQAAPYKIQGTECFDLAYSSKLNTLGVITTEKV